MRGCNPYVFLMLRTEYKSLSGDQYRSLGSWSRGFILSLAISTLSACSSQMSEPQASDEVSLPSSNLTLEPNPAESTYSFEDSYRGRYGDDVTGQQDQQGQDTDDQ